MADILAGVGIALLYLLTGVLFSLRVWRSDFLAWAARNHYKLPPPGPNMRRDTLQLVRAFSDHSSGFSAYWLLLPLCWPIILLVDAIIRLQKNGFTGSLYMHLLGGEIEKRRPVPEAVLTEAPDYRSLPVEKPVTTEDSSDALQMLVR